jgi:LysR family transcriptional regulator, glycine cleavage system transcriptional activator
LSDDDSWDKARDDRSLPLTALRAFEAAARHMSFARAADELGVSPAAISQHIQTLEIYAGQPLFRRLGRRIELTDAGAAARPMVVDGVSMLMEAARVMRLPLRSSRVAVAAVPSFAAKWLAPRLSRFSAEHPDVDVWLTAEPGATDFAVADVDVAIRYGRGTYLDGTSELLMGETVAPACAPGFAASFGISVPADLVSAPLLHDDTPDQDASCPSWSMWFSAHGLDGAAARRGVRFNQSSLALDAALSGLGVVLAKTRLATADVAAGRLVFPFGEAVTPVDYAYTMVWPRGRTLSPAVRTFMDWIRREAAVFGVADLGGGI